jgi:hypothetical protein
MNHHKGFVSITVLLIALGVIALGVGGYVVMKSEPSPAPMEEEDDGAQTAPGDHPEEEQEGGVGADANVSIDWNFKSEGEIEGTPYTTVTVTVNGVAHEVGRFVGSCSEVNAGGGIDGAGLLTGELAAAQCWFAGGGNEIGVFAHEDGGVEIMVGELSEGEEGAGMFRGDFNIKNTIRF